LIESYIKQAYILEPYRNSIEKLRRVFLESIPVVTEFTFSRDNFVDLALQQAKANKFQEFLTKAGPDMEKQLRIELQALTLPVEDLRLKLLSKYSSLQTKDFKEMIDKQNQMMQHLIQLSQNPQQFE
jgi:hypothetical protein